MQSLPPLLSELRLGTYLQYSPRGITDVSRRSKAWSSAVKAGKPNWVNLALDRLSASLVEGGLEEFLGRKAVLVPVPRSAPLSEPNALWPARIIAAGLVERGLGKEVIPCLTRAEPVQKSSWAGAGERPDANHHLRTMQIVPEVFSHTQITLVDDIVTIGRTILAAASHVQAAYPDARVRAFGLIHTSGLGAEVDEIVKPYVGWLRRNGGWIEHDPPR